MIPARVMVIGVSHRLQGSPNYPDGVDDPGYLDMLRTVIFEQSVDFIFEEASGCGRTTAARLADSLKSVRYLDIDPHLAVRQEFGIVKDTGQPFPDVITDEERVEEDSKREEYWCKQIAERDFKSGLVICGYLHTLSVAFRLRSAGFGLKFDHYIPHDKLCSHGKTCG